jgi:hypothetical protein
LSIRDFKIPEEIHLLCLLHNIGATDSERALTSEEITNWSALEPEKVRLNVQKLIEANYLKKVLADETERYHVTVNGIRKVLSMYS